MANSFLDSSPLVLGDAVALILSTENGRYILQHRDDIEGIWHPNKWGCFGGGIDSGETPEQAIMREIKEEIGFLPSNISYFCSFNFDMSNVGDREYSRYFYTAVISEPEIHQIKIGEGRTYGVFSAEELDQKLPMVPYDQFGVLLHYRNRNYKMFSAD